MKKLALLVCALSAAVQCNAIATNVFTVGEYSYSYYVTSNGVVTIGRYQDMGEVRTSGDFKPEDIIPAVQPQPRGTLAIPAEINGQKISAIGPLAFANCTNLEKVVVPSSVTVVQDGAFAFSTNLVDVALPESVVEIGPGAFFQAKRLKRLLLPPSIAELDSSVLEGCDALEHIKIPASLVKYRDKLLSGKARLKSVWFDDGVKSIPPQAFLGCPSLTKVRLPPSLKEIGRSAFENCGSLRSLSLPEGLTSIGGRAFCGCSNLVSVTIPRSTAYLNATAFMGTPTFLSPNKSGEVVKDGWLLALTGDAKREIEIPYATPHKVARGLLCASSVPLAVTVKGVPESEDKESPLYMFSGARSVTSIRFDVPINETSDWGRPFHNCDSLREIYLHDSMTNIDVFAFRELKDIEHVRLPLDWCDFMRYGSLFSTNAYDRVSRSLAYDSENLTLMGAALYIVNYYDEEMLEQPRVAQENFERCLGAFRDYIKRHPNRYVVEVDQKMNDLELPLRKPGVFVYHMDQNTFGCSLVSLMSPKDYRLQKMWESMSEVEKGEAKLRAMICHERLCSLFAEAYDEPAACNSLIRYHLDKGNKVKKLDLYKRMARHEANRMLMFGNDIESRRPARAQMLEYLQEITDLGYAQQAQMLQLELERLTSGGGQPKKRAGGTSTGTGWFVNESCVATCWHVVSRAGKISVAFQDGTQCEAKIVAKDEANDLVVLKVSGKTKDHGVLPIRTRGAKLADKVFTVGYPLSSLLGQAQKYTEGTISAMSGISGDSRFFQVSTPIQPGNSGGALVDANGCVVGLTSAGLDAVKLAQATGTIPQNVNYAVKVRYLAALLDDAEIGYSTQSAAGDVVESAMRSTVLIVAE